MTPEPNQNDAVLVRPVVCYMKDTESRPVTLILDPQSLGTMVTPERDEDGTAGFSFDFDSKPLTLKSILAPPRDGRSVLRLTTEGNQDLEMSLSPQFKEFIQEGCGIGWRRQRSRRELNSKLRRGKLRTLSLLAVVFQEVNHPTVTRTVSPDPTTAAEFDEVIFRDSRGCPCYRIDALELEFDRGFTELTFRLAGSLGPLPPAFFRGSLSLDFNRGGPLPINGN